MAHDSKRGQTPDFLNLPCWPLILRNFGRADFVRAASTCKAIFDASKYHESWGPTVRLHKLAKRAKNSLLEAASRDDTPGDDLIVEKFLRLQWCLGQFLFFRRLSLGLSSLSKPFAEKVASTIRLRELKEEIRVIGGSNHQVKTTRFCFLLKNDATVEVLCMLTEPCDLFTRMQAHVFRFRMKGAKTVVIPWRKESFGAAEVDQMGIADKEWDLKPYVHALEDAWDVSHMSVSFFVSLALVAANRTAGHHTWEDEEPQSRSSILSTPPEETPAAAHLDLDVAARCVLNCPVMHQGEEGGSDSNIDNPGGETGGASKGYTLEDLDVDDRELATEMRLLASEITHPVKWEGIVASVTLSHQHIEMFFQRCVEHALEMLKSIKTALVNFKFHGEIMMRWSAPRDAFIRLLKIATVNFHGGTMHGFEISRSISFLMPRGGVIKAKSVFFMNDPGRGLGFLRSLVVLSPTNDTEAHITSDGTGIGSRLQGWRLQLKPTVRALAGLSGNKGLCDVCVMSFFLWILVGDFRAVDKLVGALCDVARGGNGDARFC